MECCRKLASFDYDLHAWRENQEGKGRGGKEWAEGFAMMDLDGGLAWDLVTQVLFRFATGTLLAHCNVVSNFSYEALLLGWWAPIEPCVSQPCLRMHSHMDKPLTSMESYTGVCPSPETQFLVCPVPW